MGSNQLLRRRLVMARHATDPEPAGGTHLTFLAAARRAAAIALALVLLVSGCRAGDGENDEFDRALIAAPMVGDLYAAELTYFSDASFENEAKVYGLLEVRAVDQGMVTLVTENAGSASERVPREEIRGRMRGIEFDDSEQIDISLAELLQAYEAGKIFAVQRGVDVAGSNDSRQP